MIRTAFATALDHTLLAAALTALAGAALVAVLLRPRPQTGTGPAPAPTQNGAAAKHHQTA
ncbi:hypothetical protein ACFQ0M_23125 [Kitasatospora aburaviensis]